jgi:hypothetical protein
MRAVMGPRAPLCVLAYAQSLTGQFAFGFAAEGARPASPTLTVVLSGRSEMDAKAGHPREQN